jgi:hypothetical protein
MDFSPETRLFGMKGRFFRLKWDFSIHNELWYYDLDLKRNGRVRKYVVFGFNFIPLEVINSTLYNLIFLGAKLSFRFVSRKPKVKVAH